jgi:MFS family permease
VIFYGWVIVGAGMVFTCIGLGAMQSLGVFLQPMAETTGWTRSGISVAALLNWLAMGFASLCWGALSDRVGTRLVVLSGGALLGLGLVMASQATTLGQFQLLFGVLVGAAAGSFYAPLTATTTRWFTRNRSLAVALVSAGLGISSMTIGPLARWMITTYGWRTAMLVIGDLAWLVVLPTALLVKNPPAPPLGSAPQSTAGAGGREFTAGQALRTPQFAAIALTHFACCAAHSGPIFHMVTHAIDQGIGPMTAAAAFGVSGFASIAGRLGGGLLADRVGAKRTLVAGLTLQAAMIVLYLAVRDVGPFYALSFAFGVFYGGVMPLYALVTREYFGEKVMGAAYGGVFLVSTLGMGLGSFAGGVLYDRLGSYTWLYAGSFAIGAAAVLLALTFRAPRALPLPAPAR